MHCHWNFIPFYSPGGHTLQ